MQSGRPLFLASASPRRQELLRQIGVPFQLIDHQADEQRQKDESPERYVQRLAEDKARSVLSRIPADRDPVVLGADTIVVCQGRILGKPVDRQDALAMLHLLSDNPHQVLSAVTVLDRKRAATALSVTTVRFRALSDEEIAAYWASGEPRDKAGAYAIQGLGAVFVSALQGSYSGVVGLPLFETAGLLAQFGVQCWNKKGAERDTTQ